jgi:hypothetical protein
MKTYDEISFRRRVPQARIVARCALEVSAAHSSQCLLFEAVAILINPIR